eukprot:1158935-Pelagomonas_calceolata.AAC.5
MGAEQPLGHTEHLNMPNVQGGPAEGGDNPVETAARTVFGVYVQGMDPENTTGDQEGMLYLYVHGMDPENITGDQNGML